MNNKAKISLGIFFIVLMALSFYRLDYYITKPGGTYDVSDFLAVQQGDEDDEGAFYMTTVAMGRATPITYARSLSWHRCRIHTGGSSPHRTSRPCRPSAFLQGQVSDLLLETAYLYI